MNVRQLRERLAALPDYMPVVYPDEYGPYSEVESASIEEHNELGAVVQLD